MHHNEPRPIVQPDVKIVEQEKLDESEEKADPILQVNEMPETSKEQPDGDESDGEDEKSHKDICSPRVSVVLVIRKQKFKSYIILDRHKC